MNNTKSNVSVGILGVGSAVPEKKLTNQDIEKIVETSDEWIIKRTGISERRIIDDNMPLHILAAEAAEKALKSADIKAEELDLIIVSSVSSDYNTPIMACLIQSKLGATKAAAFDLNAACTGTIYAITVAQQFIQTGLYNKVLVVSAEALSRITDYKDRNTCILFGDGVGAVVLGKVEAEYGIKSTYLGADGEGSKLITIPGVYKDIEEDEKRQNDTKNCIRLDGQEVFKFAAKVMDSATMRVIEEAGLTINDIKLIVPHQANIRIIDNASKRLGIPQDMIFTNLHKYGNCSSASLLIALDEAITERNIKKGDNLVFVAFGGGLTWGSLLIKWSK